MQVKDYLTALVDDIKIRVEKIGSGNWYWCFRGDDKKLREQEVKKWEREKESCHQKVEEAKNMLLSAREERSEGDNEEAVELPMTVNQFVLIIQQGSRENMLVVVQNLMATKEALLQELASYADSDPMEVERQRNIIKLYKETINKYVGK